MGITPTQQKFLDSFKYLDPNQDPTMDRLVELAKQGKTPTSPLRPEQTLPYLKGLYQQKQAYLAAHPQPVKNSFSTEECSSQEIVDLKRAEAISQQAQLDIAPIVDPYTRGVEFGTQLAATTGPQDVMFGESHDQTAQWDAFVGTVRGLRAAGDKRQIIIIDEMPRLPGESLVGQGIEYWNDQRLNPVQSTRPPDLKPGEGWGGDSQLTDLGSAWKNSLNVPYGVPSILENAQNGIGQYSAVPREAAFNAISKMAPDVMYFPIDVNNSLSIQPFPSRDTAKAMMWAAIRKAYPDAIIMGSLGAEHGVEQKADHPTLAYNQPAGLDRNDPLAEQRVYANSQNGEDGAARVHTIRIRPTGNALIKDSSGEMLYENNGYFDEVWHVNPQPQGPESTWEVPQKWFDPLPVGKG